VTKHITLEEKYFCKNSKDNSFSDPNSISPVNPDPNWRAKKLIKISRFVEMNVVQTGVAFTFTFLGVRYNKKQYLNFSFQFGSATLQTLPFRELLAVERVNIGLQ
jgi:hypothetical protein